MQRVRIKYTKDNPFIGHLDVVRLWERAIRRTELPILYSEGFNPRQKISFGPPLPLGFTSECELLDLLLKENYSLGNLEEELNKSLPMGFKIISAKNVPLHFPSLSKSIKMTTYRCRVSEDISAIIKEILRKEKIIVNRQSKQIDIRPFIKDITQSDSFVFITAQCDEKGALKGQEIKDLFGDIESLSFRRTKFHF